MPVSGLCTTFAYYSLYLLFKCSFKTELTPLVVDFGSGDKSKDFYISGLKPFGKVKTL